MSELQLTEGAARSRAVWSAGHWDVISRHLPPAGETVLDIAGVDSPGEPAAVPLLLLLFPLATTVTGLFPAWLSRAPHRPAGLSRLAATGDATTFGQMMRRLHTETLADLAPSRWRRLRAGHPPAAERMAMAAAWGDRADRST